MYDQHLFVIMFDLILYVPVNNFPVMWGRVFLGLTSTKQRFMCLAEVHNTFMLVRLEPATPRPRVKHSTTEPLRSRSTIDMPKLLNFKNLNLKTFSMPTNHEQF